MLRYPPSFYVLSKSNTTMETLNQQPSNASEISLQKPILSRNIAVAISGVIIILAAILAILLSFGPTQDNAERNLAAATVSAAETAFSNVELQGSSAMVIDLKAGKILFEKNPD